MVFRARYLKLEWSSDRASSEPVGKYDDDVSFYESMARRGGVSLADYYRALRDGETPGSAAQLPENDETVKISLGEFIKIIEDYGTVPAEKLAELKEDLRRSVN
jgi:hypothetical protein